MFVGKISCHLQQNPPGGHHRQGAFAGGLKMQPLVDTSCSDSVGSRRGLTVDESLYEYCICTIIYMYPYIFIIQKYFSLYIIYIIYV